MTSNNLRENRFDDYHIELSMSVMLPIETYINNYINHISGDIFYAESFDEEEDELCGKLTCLYFNGSRIASNNVSFERVISEHDSETAEVLKLFNSRLNHKTDSLTKAAYTALNFDEREVVSDMESFIFIKRLELAADHRGKGVGVHFLLETLRYLTEVLNARFFAMKPFPLQCEGFRLDDEYEANNDWEESLMLDLLEKNPPKALKKLRNLYSELGFKPVKGTQLMVCKAYNFNDF